MRRRVFLWVIPSAACLLAGAGRSAMAASPPSPADDAGRERFLSEGRLVRARAAPGGITLSRRATLSLDGVEHDAHIQTIDEAKPMANLEGGAELDFRDSYRHNVVAYRLDRLLGLGMVPVTVVRAYEGRDAAYTWWVDGVRMSEGERLKKKVEVPDPRAWNHQIFVVRAFDQLIYNTDRNLGNLLIDADWRIWMIDHTRAFKIFKRLDRDEQLGRRCARQLLSALRGLDEPTLRERMKDLLIPRQVEALLARRDQIVAYYDAKLSQLGEAAVLYDLPPRAEMEPREP